MAQRYVADYDRTQVRMNRRPPMLGNEPERYLIEHVQTNLLGGKNTLAFLYGVGRRATRVLDGYSSRLCDSPIT